MVDMKKRVIFDKPQGRRMPERERKKHHILIFETELFITIKNCAIK